MAKKMVDACSMLGGSPSLHDGGATKAASTLLTRWSDVSVSADRLISAARLPTTKTDVTHEQAAVFSHVTTSRQPGSQQQPGQRGAAVALAQPLTRQETGFQLLSQTEPTQL